MPRGRYRYMRDRADRRRNRRYDYDYDYDYKMDYRDSRDQYGDRYDSARGRDGHYPEERYMEREQFRKYPRMYDYDMRGDYRDNRYYDRRDSRDRDYAEEDMDEEYKQDLEKWISKIKKDDRFGLPKDQVIQKAKSMKVDFKDFTEEEFYAIYLMHVSDYPSVANEPHTYLAMAKAWLEDKDLKIEPSEKVCKYLYEIVMAEE